jgi:uncharacterized DUF497 family protein
MGLIFEWDPVKAEENLKKHGIRFEEAMTVFDDESAITIFDFSHSKEKNEDRYVNLGQSHEGNALCVLFTEREDRIRIIHARRANREERRFYETNTETDS